MPVVLSGFGVTPEETTIAVSLGVSDVPDIEPITFSYVFVPTGESAPSDTQIEAGQKQDGSSAPLAFDQSASADGPVATNDQALADATYDVYCVAKGTDAAFSNVVSDTGIVVGGTDASVTTDVGVATGEGQAPVASAGSEAAPDVGTADAEGVAPEASAGSAATPDVGEAAAEGVAPEATAGGGATTRRALELDSSSGTAGGLEWDAGTPGYSAFSFEGWVYIPTGIGASSTIFAGPSGTVQLYTGNSTSSTELLFRVDGTGSACSTGTGAFSLDTWFHLRIGARSGGTANTIIQVNGTQEGIGNTPQMASTALNGTWYLLQDDPADDDTPIRLADVCLFSVDRSVGDSNFDAGAWRDLLDDTGIICRLDGQTSGDAGQDSSGNGNHWSQSAGGGTVVTSESSLPPGFNP